MRIIMKTLMTVFFAVLFVGAPLLSVSSAKDKEVFIGGVCAMTGPVSEQIVSGVLGMEDAFKYFNDHGGVDGVKIRFKYHDNRYKVQEAVSIYKRFLPMKPIAFALWDGSAGHEALKNFMAKDKIPGIAMAMSDPQFYPPGWIFADSCSYGDQSAAFFDWYRSKWKKDRKIRIAYLTWNNPYGLAGYEEMKKYVASRGGEVVGIEFTTYAPTTVMPQLMKIKKMNPDYIWSNSYHPTIDVILKEMAQAGMKTTLVGNTNHPTDAQIMISGADLCEGYIGCQPWYSEDYELKKDLPKAFLELMKEAGTRRGGAKVHHQCYSRGWQHAMFYREAIRLALKEVGFDKLNGDALMKYGLLRINNFFTPLTKMPAGLTNKDDRRLSPYVRFCEAKGGKSIPITGWLKAPWLKKEVEEGK